MPFGPIGVGIGIFAGALIGGVCGGLVSRAIERKPLEIFVYWEDDRYPEVFLDNIKDKSRFVYVVAIDSLKIDGKESKVAPWMIMYDLGFGEKDSRSFKCKNTESSHLMKKRYSLDVFLFEKRSKSLIRRLTLRKFKKTALPTKCSLF